MGLGSAHLLMLFVVAVLLFDRNKIADGWETLPEGIKSFKNNLANDEGGEDLLGNTL